MLRRFSMNELAILVFLSMLPLNVYSFNSIKIGTLPERLMGVRPQWIKMGGKSRQSQLQSHRPREQSTTKQDQANMLEFMNEQPNSLHVNDLDPRTPLDCDTIDLLHCIVRAADGRKADNICALKVHHVSTLTSALVILSGNSRPQNQAIAAAITKDVLMQFDQRPGGGPHGIPEGSAESGWMLLDYGAVMVHIMTPKSRLFYNVQGQWMQRGAKEIDLSDILIPNTVPTAHTSPANNGVGSMRAIWPEAPEIVPDKDEDDPFWS